jgi:predicted ATPase
VSVVVLSHSEIFLKAAQLAVRSGALLMQDFVVANFASVAAPSAELIYCRPSGQLEHWPKGFFDTHTALLGALAH